MELDPNEIVKALQEEIGHKSLEIAILKATIAKLTELPKITTAVTDEPKVQGTQGIKANS